MFKPTNTVNTRDIEAVQHYLKQLQQRLCQSIVHEEATKRFTSDEWKHRESGGGITTILEGGETIEKGGINFSHITSQCLPDTAVKLYPELTGQPYQAMGVSLVLHPRNPYVPTVHANWRFFVIHNTQEPSAIWWFGGGFDLTPYYGFIEDCQHWHQTAKAACDPYGASVYRQYKQACDHYFFLPHRQEPRGIGGIFFDHLHKWGFKQCFTFIQDTGAAFLAAYLPILKKRKHYPFGEKERAFQLYRRGRYVEFNLIYDRGTTFGLQSNGRTESILISLPPVVHWRYHWQPEPGSKEAELYETFLVPKEWAT